MEPYYMTIDLFCTLCENIVALKETELEEHMDKVHTINAHFFARIFFKSRIKNSLTQHKN